MDSDDLDEFKEVREKPSQNGKFALRLLCSINRLDYAEEFSVMHGEKSIWTPIPRASWADTSRDDEADPKTEENASKGARNSVAD